MECTVIIPIGPGHEQLAEKALQSVFLASQEGMGKFDHIHVVLGDDTKGEKGRSKTRNECVFGVIKPNPADPFGEKRYPPEDAFIFSTVEGESPPDVSRSEWIFFLDADDLMCSRITYGQSAFEVVSPYLDDYDCIWGSIHEVHGDGQVIRRKQIDYITSYKSYVKTPPMLSCQMGHFVRRSAFPGFDESMDVCEDIKLYLYEWKELKCIKQEKPLFLNRRGAHSWLMQGESDRPMPTGRDWSIKAKELLKEARDAL